MCSRNVHYPKDGRKNTKKLELVSTLQKLLNIYEENFHLKIIKN